ncbi:penicillin-binding protein [Candidatus Giovannonibacteria bacterium]|nr:penicillin-binding protein [Candidatus Giovannonibacteria bacterium]
MKRYSSFLKRHKSTISVFFIGAAAALSVFTLWILYVALTAKIPDLNDLNERIVTQSTKIYDRTGTTMLYDIHGEENRTVIPFENIPAYVKNSAIALEDDSFYTHFGVRPVSLLRAVLVNFLSGSAEQGGSTITQQLVKNTFLTPEKTITRKIKEIILSLKVERKYSKDEILALYLNQIPFGSSAYGIEAAAETFFNKKAKDLNLIESAYLSSMVRATTYYSPYGKHKDDLDNRAKFALERMLSLKLITKDEYDANIKKLPLKFSPKPTSASSGMTAPHFVTEVKESLSELFGDDVIERGGFKVTTTLDVSLQAGAEDAVNKFAQSNQESFNANNSSIVAIDPKTGDVLAMVGSKDFFGEPEPKDCSPGVNCAFDPQVNIAVRNRQPGSAFKPFVYATALKKGYTPDTVVFDIFTEFNVNCLPNGVYAANPAESDKICYHPGNYDNKFRGPVTFREALAQSLNIPSVKVLYLAGLDNSLETAKKFGITTLANAERYGLTLVLGGGEVNLLELTSAYGIFANEGVRNPHRYILKIEDKDSNVLFEAKMDPSQVIDENIAKAMNQMLSDNNARAPSFGEFSALYFPGKEVAAKTGTTNDYRDAWIVGYTPSVIIGAWAGNNDNTPMEKKVAGFIVAPIWREVMGSFLNSHPEETFDRPGPFEANKPVLKGEWHGGVEYSVDRLSGKLATEYTPQEMKDEKVIQGVHSILYWLNKDDPLGPQPSNPWNDAQFSNWETKVREWAGARGLEDQNESVIPKETDNTHVPDKFPKVKQIKIDPQKNSYNMDETITLTPEFDSFYGVAQVDYFESDTQTYLGTSKNSPFSFTLKTIKPQDNSNSLPLSLKLFDSAGNMTEYKLQIPLIGISM